MARRRQKRRLETAGSLSFTSCKLDLVDGKLQETEVDEGAAKLHPLKARYTEFVEYGNYELKAWYYSPYPSPYNELTRIYVCPYTMKYFRKRKLFARHLSALPADQRHPPGDCIYVSPAEDEGYAVSTPDNPQITAACIPQIAVYEVDGAKAKLHCQNLCLLSKLFLDGKTLIWEVHEFMFYVLCERQPDGDEMVGYFSREKNNELHHLACILTLPHKQRNGYGGFIIDFSYELARRAGRPGTPERPFSDLGEAAFHEYWERTLIGKLVSAGTKLSISVGDLAVQTGILKEDVIAAIGQDSRFSELRIVHWVRSEYLVEVKDVASLQELHSLLTERKRRLLVDPERLHWTCPPTPRKQRT